MKQKTKITIGVIVIIVVIPTLFFLSEKNEEGNIPILAEYEDKIVYTTDISYNKEILENNCSELGGKFNVCDSPCATDAEMCTQVCAYTCDLQNVKK